jgi:hypothetical protein
MHCYGAPQPNLARQDARTRAGACESPHKGRTTDIVSVSGRERGMSRKKAEDTVRAGRARWQGPGLIEFLDGGPPGAGAQ